MIRFFISFVLIFLAGICASHAAERFAGEWNIVSSKLEVIVKSWGENCGPKPKSYSNSKKREVIIIARGDHLIFSRGGVRTDRCWSPNPRMRTIDTSITPGRWKRHCKTEPDDPRYEDGEYSLVAKGDDRLDYFSVSKVDWRLKGDHCVAYLEERRVYLRAETADEQDDEQGGEEDGTCQDPGPLKRLVLKPRWAQIGAGERVCFKAEGIDEKACRFPVEAVYTVTQDGEEIQGLITKGGCFSAGDTAAHAEGLYVVTARVNQKRASAEVKVAFPDLSELLSAQLKASEEIPDEKAAQEASTDEAEPSAEDAGIETADRAAAGTEEKAGKAEPAPPPVEPSRSTGPGIRVVWIVVPIGIGILVITVVLVVLIRRRRAYSFDYDDDDWIDDPYVTPSPTYSSSKAAEKPRSPEEELPLHCPKCLRAFPSDSAFCPFHGEKLVTKKLADMERQAEQNKSATGMICPKCHRGYGFDARFCPHDAQALVPYTEWRKKNVSIVIK